MKKDNKNKYWKSIEEFSNPKPFREAAYFIGPGLDSKNKEWCKFDNFKFIS